MVPGVSPFLPLSRSPARCILVAETDSSVLESLPRILHECMRDCEVDLCSSRDHAVQKLLAAPYQLIVSGVHLAEMDDFFLVGRSDVFQPRIPFVVTATPADTGPARAALGRGVFDIITSPLDTQQVRACLRLVRWHQKLRHLIAIEERARERYRQLLTASLAEKEHEAIYRRSTRIVEETLSVYTESIARIEESIKLFAAMAMTVQTQAHARAIERLDALGK